VNVSGGFSSPASTASENNTNKYMKTTGRCVSGKRLPYVSVTSGALMPERFRRADDFSWKLMILSWGMCLKLSWKMS